MTKVIRNHIFRSANGIDVNLANIYAVGYLVRNENTYYYILKKHKTLRRAQQAFQHLSKDNNLLFNKFPLEIFEVSYKIRNNIVEIIYFAVDVPALNLFWNSALSSSTDNSFLIKS